MAYDEELAGRVRAVLPRGEAVTEREMFGGVAFMLGGHMFCGIVRDALMARLGPEAADRALDQPHVRPMDFTGRPMTGMVSSIPQGCRVTRCGGGSAPPPATPAACRPSIRYRPPARAGDPCGAPERRPVLAVMGQPGGATGAGRSGAAVDT